ncbi:ATP-binding protein [Pelagimonas varians]|uniref:histidine kinase n=1 Tax=Pelagimonas varians TaxID=696760 RepID=A0A238L7Y0_9RHOB|nr:ATP-binding protein [Pelagimonas varians]PYG25450.1 two-component system sensor histidine kinase TorS [Pelagimonas varians]SMX50482.1 Aerobic respiration control sensor protein ArcB [Pelagimonas varians]
MRQTRFDTRLIQILSAMAVLAIMVGVAAIAVNRYLVRSQSELVETNLPAMQLASRIGETTEVVGTLATAFVQADTPEDLEQITSALEAAVSKIEVGSRELEGISPLSSGATPSRAAEIVSRMAENGHEKLRLSRHYTQAGAELALLGTRLESLIEAEVDLARLRITASIVGLYTGQETDARPLLDKLADQHFFAFERLTELARMVDAIRLKLQLVPDAVAPDEIARLGTELGNQIKLATGRIVYLPTGSARKEVASLMQSYQDALAVDGLIGLQRKRIGLQTAIATDSENLRSVISKLSERARQARDAVQKDGLERIAAAQKRASQITAALLGLVIAAVAAGAVLWLYARKQLVARLGNLSRRIVSVAGGDYGAPVVISGHDEIGRMEKALNILRRRAKDAERLRGNLEEAVIARTGDVVAEMKASDTARSKAEAADRSKTEFLARMSHEIRTPLNGIIGMLDLLEADEQDPALKARAYAALSSASALLDITNDILNYAGSEDSENRGNPVHFQLRDLVGQMGHQLQSLTLQKKLEAVVDLSEGAPLALFGDVVKIRQILGNLISNAVKYTKRGSVTLSVDHAVDAQNGHPVISFSIADTGVGMTQDAIAHAFDAYMRTDAAQRAGIEGMGLGLAISRNLTEALGAALTVESEPGVGSRFTLTVPLELGDPALAGDDAEVTPDITRNQSVLVIDDHAVNLMVARGYLERLGCRVREAETGAAALKATEEQRFDLVLIDLDLPDMRGEEVAALLGQMSDTPTLVALTAYLLDDTAENRAKLGVSRVLQKPMSPRALAEVLDGISRAEPIGRSTVLESLREDISDLGVETTGLIVREFLSDLPVAVEAVLTTSGKDQKKAAHKLKGAAANFRLEAFCEALMRVEEAADDEALKAVKRLASEAASTLEAAMKETGLQTDAGSTK